MNKLFFLFTIIFLISCSTGVKFNSSIPVDEINPISEDPEIKNKVVRDIILDKPVKLELGEKPEWVSELAQEVEIKKISKKSRRNIAINTDLVTEDADAGDANADAGGDANAVAEEEECIVETKPEVDIVFNVDSSYSMINNLKNVNSTFDGFIPELSNLDWRIMFDDADQDDHWYSFFRDSDDNLGPFLPLEYAGIILPIPKYLKPDTTYVNSVFIDTLGLHDSETSKITDNRRSHSKKSPSCHLPPYCQGENEQPLRALINSFTNNPTYFRDQADMAVVIFSDSDEGRSSGQFQHQVKAEEVMQAFKAQFGEDKKLIVYGIIMVPQKDEECNKSRSDGFFSRGEGVFGVELAQLVSLTGGKTYSLCADSYVPLAKQIMSDFKKPENKK